MSSDEKITLVLELDLEDVTTISNHPGTWLEIVVDGTAELVPQELQAAWDRALSAIEDAADVVLPWRPKVGGRVRAPDPEKIMDGGKWPRTVDALSESFAIVRRDDGTEYCVKRDELEKFEEPF